MPRRPTEIGPAGERTAGAIERLRTARGFAQRELADRVTALGRPMSNTMLSRIERTQRRCDVDDLVVLAAALGVSPLALLHPTP
ncbi:helix-turn-helix domain-containing protein [Streptomyces sp. NPDC098789]|uniref:helix-turn-helix domain-containing protein n=1 Tax=Streptomyces sp. NPDC098789 TaxID=3366098 RepID=UPI003823B2A7